MRHDSIDGKRFKDECFRSKDIPRPKATPRAIETLKDSKKMPIPWKMEDK